MRIKDIFEARRNPHLNPRVDPYDALMMFADRKNVFVTFTEIPKIGIKPNTKWDTPVGIYSYPLERVIDRSSSFSVFSNAVFPRNQKWVTVFELKGNNILDLQNYDHSHVWKRVRDYAFHEGMLGVVEPYKNSNIWDAVNAIADYVQRKTGKNRGVVMTSIITNVIGVHTVVDRKGLIYRGEPVQAIHFRTSFLNVLGQWENKPPTQARKQSFGWYQQQEIIGRTVNDIIRNDDSDMLVYMLEDEQTQLWDNQTLLSHFSKKFGMRFNNLGEVIHHLRNM